MPQAAPIARPAGLRIRKLGPLGRVNCWYRCQVLPFRFNVDGSVPEPTTRVKANLHLANPRPIRPPVLAQSARCNKRTRPRTPATRRFRPTSTWFQQFWTLTGASTKGHPAPYPPELAYRLIRMFSFYGDTVVDPFVGSGTTMVAAIRAGRSSIGVEIDAGYYEATSERLTDEVKGTFGACNLLFTSAQSAG